MPFCYLSFPGGVSFLRSLMLEELSRLAAAENLFEPLDEQLAMFSRNRSGAS